MRGWITGGNGTCTFQIAADDFLELGESALQVVVDDPVVERGLELELLLRDVEALLDLALALGRPCAQPLLELLPARRRDEDRHRARDAVADRERALRAAAGACSSPPRRGR